MAIPTANFLSYNSTGISTDKCDFISNICEENDVMFMSIQEHLKNSKTIDKFFCKKFPQYNSYVIPGYRPKDQDSGRPKAGLAQLNRKGLDISKDRISTSSYRIQAQVLKFPTSRVLWLNTYFPTDPQTVQFDDSELNLVLNEVTKIIEETKCSNIVWNGDLNWDPSRATGFAMAMQRFVDQFSFIPL
jgi:hypothetical protein